MKKTKKAKKIEMPLFEYSHEEEVVSEESADQSSSPLSVSAFLDVTNAKLAGAEYRVQGEIGRVQPRGTYYFFTLKDADDESTLNCFCWASVIKTCGVPISEGMEVILSGHLEIYKRTGNLTFQVAVVEMVGEGALKKAYEELKKKLEEEGLFAPEIKKPIPKFPARIALVTSRHGEAINDFTTNIGQFGFKITFKDSRVEGQRAVFDVVRAIEFFNKRPERFDVIVLIRGGGSWESLQAFNNETVARAIRSSKIPVICGIGHEGDVTIADLVSDYRASTPTGAAKKISENWARSYEQVIVFEKIILEGYVQSVEGRRREIEGLTALIKDGFTGISNYYQEITELFKRGVDKTERSLGDSRRVVDERQKTAFAGFDALIAASRELLNRYEIQIAAGDPTRQLKLGYAIVAKGDKVIKSVRSLEKGDHLDIMLHDGSVGSKIEEIQPK